MKRNFYTGEFYDENYHRGPYKGTCPICKQKAYWQHLPHLEGITFENCKTFNKSYPMIACWDCFHKTFQGEN